MNWKVEYKNEENVRLTRRQRNMVVRIMRAHTNSKEYIGTANLTITKYFASLWFYYYPSDAQGNPYLSCVKHIFIGKRGGYQKFNVTHGLGKTFNVKKIGEYYVKAENT